MIDAVSAASVLLPNARPLCPHGMKRLSVAIMYETMMIDKTMDGTTAYSTYFCSFLIL